MSAVSFFSFSVLHFVLNPFGSLPKGCPVVAFVKVLRDCENGHDLLGSAAFVLYAVVRSKEGFYIFLWNFSLYLVVEPSVLWSLNIL